MEDFKKHFRRASSMFLTESLSYEEFDSIATKGESIPKAQDFEDWDLDYLEEKIKELSIQFLKVEEEAQKTNYVKCHECGEQTIDHEEIGFCQHCLTSL